MIAERAITLRTPDGISLHGRLGVPPEASGGVVVCHPHPLYGGDMDNPVVVRAVEVCSDLGLATLRFNFRGVGDSTGEHGNGIAERLDAEAALDDLRAALSADGSIGLAGYSFGASVAAHVAAQSPAALTGLCAIAPPLAIDGAALPPTLAAFRGSLSVVGGTRDEYCPVASLRALEQGLANARVTIVEGANHFFFGKLFPLGEAVAAWARATFGR
jgi:uncharacterized protein